MSRQSFFLFTLMFFGDGIVKITKNKEKTSIFIEVFSWFRLELNQRHADFQSTALPTELQNHFGSPIID